MPNPLQAAGTQTSSARVRHLSTMSLGLLDPPLHAEPASALSLLPAPCPLIQKDASPHGKAPSLVSLCLCGKGLIPAPYISFTPYGKSYSPINAMNGFGSNASGPSTPLPCQAPFASSSIAITGFTAVCHTTACTP
jgi:hypothetical protein